MVTIFHFIREIQNINKFHKKKNPALLKQVLIMKTKYCIRAGNFKK